MLEKRLREINDRKNGLLQTIAGGRVSEALATVLCDDVTFLLELARRTYGATVITFPSEMPWQAIDATPAETAAKLREMARQVVERYQGNAGAILALPRGAEVTPPVPVIDWQARQSPLDDVRAATAAILASEAPPPACTCAIESLMAAGCTCGAAK
jgi:hypothetical protein